MCSSKIRGFVFFENRRFFKNLSFYLENGCVFRKFEDCFFENGSLFFENSIFFKMCVFFDNAGFVFFENWSFLENRSLFF